MPPEEALLEPLNHSFDPIHRDNVDIPPLCGAQRADTIWSHLSVIDS